MVNFGIRDKFYDYYIGEIVKTIWFGDIIDMEVIGYCEEKKLVQLGHLTACGSFYVTVNELLKYNQ